MILEALFAVLSFVLEAILDTIPDAEAPAEPVPAAVPGRIRLEGSALPGRDAVRVNRPGLERRWIALGPSLRTIAECPGVM